MSTILDERDETDETDEIGEKGEAIIEFAAEKSSALSASSTR